MSPPDPSTFDQADPDPAPTITCVECGGVAHLLSFRPEEGFEPGDVLVYRCEDCADRWDIVHEAPG